MPTTKSRPPPSRRTRAGKRKAAPPSSRNPVVGFAIGVVIVLGVVAVIASRGSTTKPAVPKGVQETRPVTVTGAALPPLTDASVDPAVGTSAPQLRGSTFAGRSVAIVDDGRPKLVLFVAHWCPHCQREVPLLASWLRSNGKPSGVDLYTVATGTTPDRPNYPPSAWLEREGWTVTTMADDDNQTAADAFGLSAYPFFVAVDGSGKVVARASGELSISSLEQVLQQARAD
jgi:cytochrome c biogenesis protein CcmG/thiol:disulfide interchange protein DsbE